MKVLIPRNIEKGMFNMNFQIGPLTLSIVQLFILAVGIGAALGIFNFFSRAGSRVIWIIFGVIIFIIFLVIAFFQVSELSLIPFLAKMVRTYFFDTTKKYQVNYEKMDQTQLLIKKVQADEKKQTIEQKTDNLNQDVVKKVGEDLFS